MTRTYFYSICLTNGAAVFFTQQAKEQSYSCSFCPKTLSKNFHLIRPIKTHVLTDSFECDDCGEKFSRKENLHEIPNDLLDMYLLTHKNHPKSMMF